MRAVQGGDVIPEAPRFPTRLKRAQRRRPSGTGLRMPEELFEA